MFDIVYVNPQLQCQSLLLIFSIFCFSLELPTCLMTRLGNQQQRSCELVRTCGFNDSANGNAENTSKLIT